MLMVIVHDLNICSGFGTCFPTDTCLIGLLCDKTIKMIIKTKVNLTQPFTTIANTAVLFMSFVYLPLPAL